MLYVMWAYWVGILIGSLATMIAGIIMHGCASSMSGIAIALGVIMLLSGQADMLFMIAGPDTWREKAAKAGYRTGTLLLAGLTVGALPIAITLMLLRPNLQGPFWLTLGIPLFIFAFGVPVGSWITLFALSRKQELAPNHPKKTSTPDERSVQ